MQRLDIYEFKMHSLLFIFLSVNLFVICLFTVFYIFVVSCITVIIIIISAFFFLFMFHVIKLL